MVTGMENSLEEFNNRFKQEEERISKLEDGAIELLSLRGIKEKEWIKLNRCSAQQYNTHFTQVHQWDTTKWTTLYILGVQEGEERKEEVGRIFEYMNRAFK